MKRTHLLALIAGVTLIFFAVVFEDSPLQHSNLLGKYRKTNLNNLAIKKNHLAYNNCSFAVGLSVIAVTNSAALISASMLMMRATPTSEETMLKKNLIAQKVMLSDLDR